MAWFFTHLEIIFETFAGLVVFIIGLIWRGNLIEKGYDKAHDEIAKENQKASEKVRETAEAIIASKSGDGNVALRKRLRK